MQKGAYLDITLQDPAGAQTANMPSLVQSALNGAHHGLNINVLNVTADPAQPSTHHAILYVHGDQPAPDNFKQLATNTIQRLWSAPPAPEGATALAAAPAAPRPQLLNVSHWEGYDDEEDTPNTLGADLLATAAARVSRGCMAPVTGGDPTQGDPLPADTERPAPVDADYDGCPPVGDGSDGDQNTLKNRTDAGDWQVTTAGAILALPVPEGLSRDRAAWSAGDQAAIGHYEGLPLQVVGYLAGARIEGPESCNCHSVSDLDFHLWFVDSAGTARDASVVCEVTPRVRADHPGWTEQSICSLVNNQTQVRLSGWLMMDPAHPDQVGKTRGTTWEIHPIIAFDVAQDDGTWVALDDANL